MNKMNYYRTWKNLTQEQVADILCISKNTYRNYETSAQLAKPFVVNKLADYYGISVNQLYNRELQRKIIYSKLINKGAEK